MESGVRVRVDDSKNGVRKPAVFRFLLGLSTSRIAQGVILRCKNTFFTDGIAPGGDPVLKLAGNPPVDDGWSGDQFWPILHLLICDVKLQLMFS